MLWLDDSLTSRVVLQKRALLFACVTVLILFVFQPFGTYESTLTYKYLRLAGYGVATFLAVFVAGFIEISWSHYRGKLRFYPQLIIGLYITIAALFNHSYFVVAIYPHWRIENQLMFVLYVSAIAIFPITIMYLRAKTAPSFRDETSALQVEQELNETDLSKDQAPVDTYENQRAQRVSIVGENKSDVLSVALGDIVLLKSADNYCEIVTKQGDNLASNLLRISLSKVLKQLPENEFVVRCHRSFGVNLSLVKSHRGNATGLKLDMLYGDVVVPVSRSYVSAVKEALSLTPKACDSPQN